MPIYTPALDLIVNLADRQSSGRLALSGSRVVAGVSPASSRIVLGDTGLCRVRAVTPNLAGERAFDDVDLSVSTVRIALGVPGEDPYCLATLSDPAPAAAAQVTSLQSATAALPATKRITLDPAPYAGTWLLTLDALDPIELPFDAEPDRVQAALGLFYAVRKVAENAWEISGTEPNQDLTIAVDVSGLLVPLALSGPIALNTTALAAAFAAAASGTPPSEPKWLRVTREVEIDGIKVFQDDKVEIARAVLDLSALVPTPLPPSDVAAINTALAGKQPINATLSAIASLLTTAWGRTLLTLADAGALRTYASAQPLSAPLTAIAALATAAYGRSLLTTSSSAAARLLLALDQINNTSDADKPVSTAQAGADAAVANAAASALAALAATLSNVDNTSDADKPVSTAQATADSAVASAASAALGTHTARTDNPHTVTKAQVGLGNVDNTTDANKPVSTPQQNALDLKAAITEPIAATHAARTDNPHAVTKTQVGLGNVDNTADANKPVSTAQAAALNLKADDSGVVHNHAIGPPGPTVPEIIAGEKHFTDPVAVYSLAGNSLVATILSNPGAPTVTPIGNDEGATWSYRIVAILADQFQTAAGPVGTTTHGDETLDATNKNSLTWAAVPGAATYDVYRTAVGISPSTTGKIATVATNAYVDTGAAGDGTTPPSSNSTGIITAQLATIIGALTAGRLSIGTLPFVVNPDGTVPAINMGDGINDKIIFYQVGNTVYAFSIANGALKVITEPGAVFTVCTRSTDGLATEVERARVDGQGLLAGDYRVGVSGEQVTVTIVGDSIPAINGGVGHYMNGTDAPAIAVPGGLTLAFANVAVAGTTINQLLDGIHSVTANFRQHSGRNIVILMAGTNNFGNAGETPEQTIGVYAAFCRHLQKMGIEVGAATMISRGPAATGGAQPGGANAGYTWDQIADQFDDKLRASWRGFANFLIDFRVLDPTVFGAVGGYANKTYYNDDDLHPIDAGTKRLDNLIVPVLNAYIASGGVMFGASSTGDPIFEHDSSGSDTVTIPAGGVITPFGNLNNFSGPICVVDLTSDGIGEFLTGAGVMNLKSQCGTSFSNTKDTANKINVYVEGSVVKVQNTNSASVIVSVTGARKRNSQ